MAAAVAFRQLIRMADLRRQATTDHLTGLPNRRALYAQAGARMLDPVGERHALLLVDLDRFKEVNDSLGHQAGDKLLIQVGVRLGAQLREGDLLVRLGGDEFALLLDGAAAEEATAVAVKLCAALAEPFALEDVAVHSAVSIGFALFPTDGSQFVVHYQPKIDLPAGEVRELTEEFLMGDLDRARAILLRLRRRRSHCDQPDSGALPHLRLSTRETRRGSRGSHRNTDRGSVVVHRTTVR